MNHPNVILRIDRYADHAAQDPMIWQRLWPHRIHLEARGLPGGTLRGRRSFEPELSRLQRDKERQECPADI